MGIKKLFLLMCMVLLGFETFAQNGKGDIKIIVTNLDSTDGVIVISLYNQAEGFPSDESASLFSRKHKINGDTLTYEFTKLPYGEYAVAILHDENNNGKLDTNFVGIPKEGIGVSNDAIRMMGPPKYEDSKFNLNSPQKTIHISTYYY